MVDFGKPRIHLVKCTSTNDAARGWALHPEDAAPLEELHPNNLAPSGALVTADFQTRGRGQRGHEWQAEAGQSALMSFVYRLPADTDPGQLGIVTALAVAEGLATLGVSPQIKWPNDILLSGRKCGGILVEVAAGVAILGIGINVSQEQFVDAAEFAYPPTSLRLASGRERTVTSVVEVICEALSLGEERWRRDGFAAILERCQGWLAIGARVHQGEVSGELIGLTDNGAAAVRLPDGTFQEWTTVN